MFNLLDYCDESKPTPTEGDQLRDVALARLRESRPVLVRGMMRAFLLHLLANGEDTSDAIRALVPIPPMCDPRVVGSAVRGLAEWQLIHSVGRRKSSRGVAHSRKLDVWALRDAATAEQWLRDHPELD